MRLGDPETAAIFIVAALTVIVSMLPLLFVERDAAAPVTARPLAGPRLIWLYRISPIGVVVTMLIGAANGPFWSLTPVYATAIGLDAVASGTLMTMITLGAAMLQFPVGRLSDAVDRRRLLVWLTLITAALEIALFVQGASIGGPTLMIVAFLIGGFLSTQYYVTSAHTNDRTGRDNVVSVASALLFLYCIGAMIGPVTASKLMEALGPGALYLHNATLHIAVAIFVVYRILRRPSPPRARGRPLR